MRIAKRMERLGTETAFEVLAEVTRLRREGKEIISFSIGEPDFDTPENIKKTAIEKIEQNFTHYGPSAGLPEAREAIAQYISKTRNIEAKPEQVVVTPGAKPIIFFSILALVEEGDEVLYPNPGFPIYESMIHFVGAKAVPMPLLEEEEFSFDPKSLEQLVSSKTKLVILNSPQNPTGGVIPKESLQLVAELSRKYNFWVLSDEVYSRIVYEGEFQSISQFDPSLERTILLDGHSKTYAMTGWRLGYGVMNPKLAEHLARLMTNSNSCTCTFTQLAGIEALEGPQDGAEAMKKEFHKRRDLIVDGLNQIPGIRCLRPKGAFYVFPNVTEVCRRKGWKDSKELQDYLLYEAGVALLGRTCFGQKNKGETEEYVRLSYATSLEEMEKGLDKMKKALT